MICGKKRFELEPETGLGIFALSATLTDQAEPSESLKASVVWQVGLPMGLAQMAGAWVGSHLVIRHGTRLIRPLLVVVSLAISLKLLLAD